MLPANKRGPPAHEYSHKKGDSNTSASQTDNTESYKGERNQPAEETADTSGHKILVNNICNPTEVLSTVLQAKVLK